MKETLIAVTLLVGAIVFISWGISTGNPIMTIIEGLCAGVYNFVLTTKEK